MTEYYVLSRWELDVIEYQIVSCAEGQDPLHGYGSFDLFSGPFDSWEEAEEEAYWVEEIGEEA